VTVTVTRVPTGEALTVLLVMDVAHGSDARTVVHPVIGRTLPDFTVRPIGPRTGTWHLLCATETTALQLEALLRTAGPFRLADTDTNIADRTFVVTGRLAVQLDTTTQKVCTVTADYTESV
jgi:hypothetical protein